jgi:hypothetical protein
MENNNEIIINESLKKPKVKKPLTEEQREKQKLDMRNYYLARKMTLNILNVKDFQVKHIITIINKKY